MSRFTYKPDVKITKILKGAGIAGAGAAVTYLLGAADVIDVSVRDPFLVAIISTLLNAGKVYIERKAKEQKTHVSE